MPPTQGFQMVKDEEVLRQAEILALRQMSDTLKTISLEMRSHRDDLSTIKIDVAVVKERQERNAELREAVKELEIKVEALETRKNKQDGAVSFLQFVKDFGPWLITLVVMYFSLFNAHK